MKTVKHHVVLVMGPSNHAYDVSEKAGLMYLNRFSIDEEAAFESTGVYSLQKSGTKTPYSLRYRFFWNGLLTTNFLDLDICENLFVIYLI